MLRRVDFENDAVAWRAANPSSFGYHHGPVPYWHRQRLANANNNANQPQPFPAVTISKVNTGVCDVELDGTGSMCGTIFRDQPSLRRHLRDSHPGAAHNPTRTNVSVAEQAQGETAIKRWILTGGWRDARYVREPGQGPEGGLIARYADACESIAREDEEFKRKFGEFFHRRAMQENPEFQPGRKSRARKSRESAAEAEAPGAQLPPPSGPTRSARPGPSQSRAGHSRVEQAHESILISDDDEEDVKVKIESSPP